MVFLTKTNFSAAIYSMFTMNKGCNLLNQLINEILQWIKHNDLCLRKQQSGHPSRSPKILLFEGMQRRVQERGLHAC
jgi:hypothetical protein